MLASSLAWQLYSMVLMATAWAKNQEKRGVAKTWRGALPDEEADHQRVRRTAVWDAAKMIRSWCLFRARSFSVKARRIYCT